MLTCLAVCMAVMQRALPASSFGMVSRFCTWAGIRPSRCVMMCASKCPTMYTHASRCRNPMKSVHFCWHCCLHEAYICACQHRCCMCVGCKNEAKRHSRCGCPTHCGGCSVFPAGQPSCGGFLSRGLMFVCTLMCNAFPYILQRVF